jgi:hypothetical protein
MPVDINKLIESTKNRNLQNQVTTSKAKVKAQGGKVKKGGPSILNRIFDVISRPLYAVSEGVARASEHAGPKNPRKGKSAGTDILKGIAGGLAGKNKTYMNETLLRAAEADPGSLLSKPIRENKYNLRTGAGFVGDIALDPTTYVGGAIVKGVAKGTAKTAGAFKAVEHISDADKVRKVLESADAAKKARVAKGPVKTIKGMQSQADVLKSAEKTAQKVVKAETKIIRKEGQAIGRAHELNLLASTPGKVQFKFAGKKFAESEKLYRGSANLGKIVKNTAVGGKLSEAFRAAHKFPEITNQLKREAELRGIAHAETQMKEVRSFFKELPKDDKVLISHTIEKGKDAVTSTIASRPELAPFFEKAIKMQREMGELEVKRGVFRAPKNKDPNDYLLDNYVYHYYEGGSKKAREGFKNKRRSAVGPESPNFTKLRQVKTLEDAKAYGLKPIESIDDILVRRSGKHHAAVARAEYVQAVTKEYGVDVGTKWAKEMKDEGIPMVAARSKYAPKGTVFPEHIAKSIDMLEDMHTSDELYNSFLKTFDKAQNYWKFGATSLNPGHHVRNLIGDAWNGFLDGVVDPRHYENAAKALWGKDDGFKVIVNGKPITRPKLMELYVESGTKPGFVSAELLQGEQSLTKGFRGKVNTIAEKREEYMRMAHFLHALKEEAPKFKNLTEAASSAGARVRKWKIDYGDLTDFERNVMKRAIPFYTWSRKNLPLQIEALALKPGRVGVIPKGQSAIQDLMGTNTEGGGVNFGDLDTIPKWMKEMAPIRLRGEGEGKNAIYWLPALPFQDISKYAEGGEQEIFRSIMSQITPAARIPIEKATGEALFSGAKVKGNAEYASQQVPLARILQQLTKKGEGVGGRGLTGAKLANYLTGLGIQEVTPGQKAGELQRQKDPLQSELRSIRDKARKKALGG